jgi:hypothetical protein
MTMKKLIVSLLALCALVALSPAPIKSKWGYKVSPEKSDAARAQEQQARRLGEVGQRVEDTEKTVAPPFTPDDSNQAAGNVISAYIAEQVVKEASVSIEKQKGGTPFNWFGALLLIAGALGIVQAFKMWAKTNLPDAPDL